MEAKFKVGDKVKLNEPEDSVWGRWAKENCDKDKEYIVVKVYDQELGGSYIDMDGVFLTHKSSQFEIKPQVLTIVLRRPVDRRSVEKFLNENGYTFQDGASNRRNSRIIQIHLEGNDKGKTTYNAKCPYSRGTKEVIEHTNEFLSSMWRYERIKVIKTKPSVKQAINQIKKYI